MGGWIKGFGMALVMSGAWMGLSAFEAPPEVIKIALQEGDTAAWELAAMHELALDEINEIELKIRNVADSKAGQAALQAGKRPPADSYLVCVAEGDRRALEQLKTYW